MAYKLYNICIKEIGIKDAILEEVIVSVGETCPNKESKDDNITFYHFSPDEWDKICKVINKGRVYKLENEFLIEEIQSPKP